MKLRRSLKQQQQQQQPPPPLMFRHGLPTSSLASRDPYAQYRLWRGLIPAITHSSHPKLTDHNIPRRPNPKSITTDPTPNRRPTPFPSLTEPFKGRPPITLQRRTNSQRKALHRKIRYLHKQIPKSTPKPRCARLRIWYRDARKRRSELREKEELTRQIERAGFDPSERASVLFRMLATLHRISVQDPAQSPISPPSRQRTHPNPTTFQLRPHIGPLTPHGNFFSVDDPP